MDAVYALKTGPTELLRQASTLESEGQLTAAAELNNRALELDPKLTQAHVNLISAYGRLGDVKKAEEHFRLAIAQNPNAADAHYNFGCFGMRRIANARRSKRSNERSRSMRVTPKRRRTSERCFSSRAKRSKPFEVRDSSI